MSTSKEEQRSKLGGRPPSESDSSRTPPELSEEDQERRRALGLPPDAPEELVDAAEGDTPEKDDPEGDEVESTVLGFLLGPTTPLEYDVETWVDTPAGREKLVFHIRQVDDTRLDALEKEYSEGAGPFRVVDRLMLNAAKAAEATVYLEDADGKRIDPSSREWRGPIPSGADAFRGRFKFQPGILAMVASEVDGIAGSREDRVGVARPAAVATAEEAISTAVGNS